MPKQLITIEEVKKIAALSKLDISGDEEKFTELFQDTLSYIQVLNELDTSDVEETFQVTGLKNVFMDKNSSSTLTQEEALKNAKLKGNEMNGLFTTKAVFER